MRALKLHSHPNVYSRSRSLKAEPDQLTSEKYVYNCAACGSCNGPWHAEESPELRECYDCGASVRRTPYNPLYSITVKGDIPDHYSADFDTNVRSRRHLRDLQTKQGTKDYEVVRGPQDGWK